MNKESSNVFMSSMDNLESLLPETLQIRCPQCFKPFLMHTDSITSDRPHFQCHNCRSLFFISFPECLDQHDIFGTLVKKGTQETFLKEKQENRHPDETSAAPVKGSERVKFQLKTDYEFQHEVIEEKFPCPKCNELYKGGQQECHRCGLVFKKAKEIAAEGGGAVSASEKLRSLWEKVITDYDNLIRHEVFLKACDEESNLAYASYRYGKIVNAYAGDAIAQKMIRQIQEIVGAQLGLAPKKVKNKSPFGWLMFFMLIGVVMIGVGFGIPQLRNMVGFGVATLFLTLTVKFYFK